MDILEINDLLHGVTLPIKNDYQFFIIDWQSIRFVVDMRNILALALLLVIPNFSCSQDLKNNSSDGMIYSLEFCFGAGVGNVRIDNSILDANYERTYGLKFLSAYKFDSDLSVGASAMYDYFSDSGFLLLGG
ncbi:MAG: hypothetical protein WBG42_07310, partial [Cryomorphaceae bacterium]